MNTARVRTMLFVAGLLLVVWGVSPRLSAPASAAPSLLITETPTSEPPTPTNTATPEPGGGATATPTNTPLPGATATPTNTPVPPVDSPDDDDDPTRTPEPTSTPMMGVVETPVAEGPGPDPAVSKSVSPATALVGDTVVYTVLVSNLGGAPATGVVVEDTLPGFLSLVNVSATRGTVTSSGQSVRVEIGDLGPGETVEVQVSARVNAAAAAPNNRNLATVSSTSPDTNPDNNQASVPLDAAAPVSLPNTADEGGSALPALATALGLALVAGSVLMGRGARRASRRPRG